MFKVPIVKQKLDTHQTDNLTKNPKELAKNISLRTQLNLIYNENIVVLRKVKLPFIAISVGMSWNYCLYPIVPQRVVSQCNDKSVESSQSYCDIFGGDLFGWVLKFYVKVQCVRSHWIVKFVFRSYNVFFRFTEAIKWNFSF